MERQLIPLDDQRALREAPSTALSAEEARVRNDQRVPVDWRLESSCAAFYNPTGMTQADITAYDAADRAARCRAISRQKDILATLAVIVRAKNTAVWNAMTTQQKVDATLAEADVWQSIRVWAETNL